MDEKIADAIALAQFSNLETSGVENFRNGVAPDFLPVLFWNLPAHIYPPPGIPGKHFWQQLQHIVRQLWVDGFPAEKSAGLMVNFANTLSLWRETQALLIRSPEQRTPEQLIECEREKEEAARYATPKPHAELGPFQVGILFLMMHPQRAVFCPRCGDRFIKLDKNKKYCSRACAQKARLDSKLGWWNEKGKKARGKKQSTRATTSQGKKVKRKE